MYDDDDLYVVIVGDDDENKIKIKTEPIEVKTEPIDQDEIKIKVEDLLLNATEYGEVIELDETIFNESNNCLDVDTPSKTLYDDIRVKLEVDADYVPTDDEFIASSESNDNEEDDDYDKEKIRKKNKKIKSNVSKTPYNYERSKKRLSKRLPSEINSYVKHLRSQFPELQEDKELLINCLVEIMKSTCRPNPPGEYYTMNGNMFECLQCSALSVTLPAAHRHYQEKHGERYLVCLACGADFRSTTNLYKHEKRCDTPDIKVVLKARALFLGRKGRSRPFLPDLSKQPPKKYYNSLRRFKCDDCTASFVSKNGLMSHQRMHRGERPFLCPQCPRAYTSQTTLMRHLQNHGSQEFICDHCSRSFKLKAALVLHMDTHAPMKKYPCAECPRRYSQKSALLVHVRRDHRKLPLPFPCQICPKRYPRMSVLKDHMKKVHGMVIMTRKMFFKQLPLLTDTQLQQAKVVLKSADPNQEPVILERDVHHHTEL